MKGALLENPMTVNVGYILLCKLGCGVQGNRSDSTSNDWRVSHLWMGKRAGRAEGQKGKKGRKCKWGKGCD